MRIDFHELVEKLFSQKFTTGLLFILCDDPLVSFLLTLKYKSDGIKTFDGKQAISNYIEDISQGSLFGEVHPSLVILADKYTDKQWNAVWEELARIPSGSDTLATFLLGPAALRNTIKEQNIKSAAPIYLAYPPNEAEAHKTMQVLVKNLLSKPPERTALALALVENYGTDFIAAATHCDRMEKGQLDFSSALLQQTQADTFQVVDALINQNAELLTLRLSQCQASGVDAGSVFGTLNYFFKQLLSVQAALAERQTLKQAFDLLRIPYPAQTRLQLAARKISTDKLVRFFRAAAHNELVIRKSKNPYDSLTIELLALIS